VATLLGAGLGAALGAVVGGGRGAGIGAASGAVLGTGVGAANAQNAAMGLQQQYDMYYANCMGAQGGPPPGGAPPLPYSSAPLPPLGQWTYVVATYDGGQARLYVDGALDGSRAITMTPSNAADPWSIGRRADGYFADGTLDEVAVYGTALTAEQVSAHWRAAGH